MYLTTVMLDDEWGPDGEGSPGNGKRPLPRVRYLDYRTRTVRGHIAQRIARARTDCGWNVAELAKVLGVEPDQVRRWESGTEDLPDLCQLLALSRATGHPVEWFFPAGQGGGWALDADESTLLFRCRRLSRDNQKYVRNVVAVLLEVEGMSYER